MKLLAVALVGGAVWALMQGGLIQGRLASQEVSGAGANEVGQGTGIPGAGRFSSEGASSEGSVAGDSLGVPRAQEGGGPSLSPRGAQQLSTVDELLEKPNDQDPRLDQELRVLEPAVRVALRKRYQQLPLEKLNPKGTLVFLVGRNLDRPEDFSFLQEVLLEAPCLNLADCSRETVGQPERDSHLDSVTETTLIYPQWVALKSLEKVLQDPQAELKVKQAARESLRVALGARHPRIAEGAKRILESVGDRSSDTPTKGT